MARALWRTRSDRGEQAQGEDNDSSAHQLFGLKEPSRFRSRTWLYWWAIVEAIVLTGLAYWLAWDFETESGVQAGGVVLIAIAVWTIIVLLFLARGDDRESGWTGALALLIRSGYYPFAAGAVVAVAFAYRNGSADAALQRQFLMSRTDRCVVVLREYGDHAVAARRVGFRQIDLTQSSSSTSETTGLESSNAAT